MSLSSYSLLTSSLRASSVIRKIAAVLFITACAASTPPHDPSRFPTYGAEAASLLDDGLSGHLFETAFVTGNAGDDPRFDERVRAAQSISLMKVATISREGSLGANRRYEVTLRTLERLSGTPHPEQVSLTISGKDPSFHWLDRVGGAWVGRELLLLSGEYRAGDSVVLHFHGEPNVPELQARIRSIRAATATVGTAGAADTEAQARSPKK